MENGLQEGAADTSESDARARRAKERIVFALGGRGVVVNGNEILTDDAPDFAVQLSEPSRSTNDPQPSLIPSFFPLLPYDGKGSSRILLLWSVRRLRVQGYVC